MRALWMARAMAAIHPWTSMSVLPVNKAISSFAGG
jgi:hypothetical protein